MSRSRCLVLLCLALLVAVPATHGAAERDLEVRLGYGYDSNALRLADGADVGAGYSELGFKAGFRIKPAKRTRLFLDLSGTRRDHESAASDADTSRARLRTGALWVPVKRARSGLAVLVGGKYELRRSTFVDPTTGQVFLYSESLPGGGTADRPIPDRFDSDTAEAFVDLRWKLNRRVRLQFATRVADRNYVEDYDTINGLDSLDYRAVTFEPGVRVRLSRVATLDLSYVTTDREYDEQPALDGSGSKVPGSLREYAYDGVEASLTVRPTGALDVRFGIERTGREDLHAGYYDSDTTSAYVWIEREFERSTATFYASRLDVSYDNATVVSDPNAGIRGVDMLALFARYERQLRAGLAIYAEAGTQDADNNDPVLAYGRDWVLSGIRYRR